MLLKLGEKTAMRGRKPVPTAIKNLRGTYREDRAVSNEAEFSIPKRMPSPPDEMNEDGKALWRSLGKRLLDAGLFTDADQVALELLCVAYGRMKEANRMVARTGTVHMSSNGNYYQNPYLSVANRSWEQVKKMLAEFGLTPAERTRVLAAINENEEEDDLVQILFGGLSE